MRVFLRVGLSLVLAAITWAVYAQVVGFEYLLLDDEGYVFGNEDVLAGLSWDGIRWAFTTTQMANWHPLSWLSWMLDVELFGPEPGPLHRTNLLLHVANTVLLFWLFTRLTGAHWRSAFLAALFALHPLHVESVAWVSERKDVLSTTFWIGTTWAYAVYATRPPDERRGLPYVCALTLFAAGLLAKPMLVTLPFALLLLDVWPLRRATWDDWRPATLWPLVREKVPFFVLSAATSVVTVAVQNVRPLGDFGFSMRLENAVVSYARYLGKAVWPLPLSPFYPYEADWPLGVTLGSLALLTVATGLCVWVRRTAPWALSGWLFYLGTLVPTIGLVHVGVQSIADRYTYVPLIGIFWIVAWSVPPVTRPLARGAVVVAAVAVLAACAERTHTYAGLWRNSTTLFEHALRATPGNGVAHEILGIERLNAGNLGAAETHLRTAIELLGRPIAHAKLGEVLEGKGQLDAARASYERALAAQPAVRTHNKLGRVLAKLGRLNEAAAQFEVIRAKYPDDAEAYESTGIVAEMRGQPDVALDAYRAAVDRQPNLTHARRRLAALLLRVDPREALQHAELAAKTGEPGDLRLLEAARAAVR